MPRISVDYYDLKKGDPIDNPLVACIASYALQNGCDNPLIVFIPITFGPREDIADMVYKVVRKMSVKQASNTMSFIATVAAISPFEYPPDKYTFEKQGEDDTRELISVDEVINKKIDELKSIGFEPIFFDEPGSMSVFCIYTGMEYDDYDSDDAKGVIEFIRSLPEENPEPAQLTLSKELEEMMDGETNDKENDISTEEMEK